MLVVACPSAAGPQSRGQSLQGIVVKVADGDTVLLLSGDKTFAVRIFGIDAPEEGQPGYEEASEALSRRVYAKQALARVVDQAPTFGRIVARMVVEGQDVGMALVSEGWAWHYRSFAPLEERLAEAERSARSRRIGIWTQAAAVPPWSVRHPVGLGLAGLGANSGLLRGNAKSKVYHAPVCQHFNCLNCVVLFKSTREAERQGFKPHRSCVR